MAPRLRQVKPPADAAPANSGDPIHRAGARLAVNNRAGARLAVNNAHISDRKDRLGLLHVALKELAAEIDDEANVPERYETSGKGYLADVDSQAIRLAAHIVHRLLLWELFPLVSPESYFKAGE